MSAASPVVPHRRRCAYDHLSTAASVSVLRRSLWTSRGNMAIGIRGAVREDVLARVGGLLMEWTDVLVDPDDALVHPWGS